MHQEKYSLIFSSAKITPEDEAKIQKKICSILKADECEIKKLFNGKKMRFLKNISYTLAKTISTQITQTGAICIIEKEYKTHLSLFDTENTAQVADFFCPICKLQQAQKDNCEYCHYDLSTYRKKMQGKGFYEVKSKGYVKEQRKVHRRVNPQRREMIRLEGNGNRRKIADRRQTEGEWGDVWS